MIDPEKGRIDRFAVGFYFVVKMGAGALPGGPHQGDHLPLADNLLFLDEQFRIMSVHGGEFCSVGYFYFIAEITVPSGKGDNPVGG